MKYLEKEVVIFMAIFLALNLLCSCEFERKKLKEDIVIMQSRPIMLPVDSMLCWWYGNDTLSFKSNNEALNFVVFSDSTKCSSCALKGMYIWDDFLQKIGYNYPEGLNVFFIFTPLQKNWKSFYITMKTIPPSIPIYVDALGVFNRNNRHIPSNPELHTFLLDSNGYVLLVGNPLENEKIEKLFWQIVEEKLGKRE